MFPIIHACTALLIKRKYPDVSLLAILIFGQLMDILWVFLNYSGIERTSTEAVVRSIRDIHFPYMPYSHPSPR